MKFRISIRDFELSLFNSLSQLVITMVTTTVSKSIRTSWSCGRSWSLKLAISLLMILTTLSHANAQSDVPLQKVAPLEGNTPANKMSRDATTEMAADFFEGWLKKHGEKETVNDKTGVGIKGKPTRLLAFRYAPSPESSGNEVEFRVVLPDGREIQEFVAGIGEQDDQIAKAAIENFALSSFHTIYAVCMNPKDEHVRREIVKIDDRKFAMTSVGLYHLSSSKTKINFEPIALQIKTAIEKSALKLGKQLHWMKIVYGQNENKPIISSVTYDNLAADKFSQQVKTLDWPKSDGFYLAKMFLMLEPFDAKKHESLPNVGDKVKKQ